MLLGRPYPGEVERPLAESRASRDLVGDALTALITSVRDTRSGSLPKDLAIAISGYKRASAAGPFLLLGVSRASMCASSEPIRTWRSVGGFRGDGKYSRGYEVGQVNSERSVQELAEQRRCRLRMNVQEVLG